MSKTKIKSFEDACKALNLTETVLPEVSALPERHRKSITAFYMLTIIAEALNEGWTPNWNNSDEWKYYNYFWVDADAQCPAGFRDSDSFTLYVYSYTCVSSRLCFKSRELAQYAREQFADLYKDYLLLN